MEMKKIACAVLVATASMSAAFAEVAAPAPAPSATSGATSAFPVVGSLVGASLLSLVAVYYN